jgi:hypothetical protein
MFAGYGSLHVLIGEEMGAGLVHMDLSECGLSEAQCLQIAE